MLYYKISLFAFILSFAFQYNRTALDNAKERGHKEVAALLGNKNMHFFDMSICNFDLIFVKLAIITYS